MKKMHKRTLNDIAEIEKAVSMMYGEEAIQNPKSKWNKEKEELYLEQIKKESIKVKYDKEIDLGDIIITERVKKRHSSEANCRFCKQYTLSKDDDLYIIKFGCCFKCYVKNIEGRS